jgi:hypothetical protein
LKILFFTIGRAADNKQLTYILLSQVMSQVQDFISMLYFTALIAFNPWLIPFSAGY